MMVVKMQRRQISSLSSAVVKQVSKANFSEALSEISQHIEASDFVAVSSLKTGVSSSPWSRILTIDTPDTAYLKSKAAAERFELLQFAVCPFKLYPSKIIAFPYNFHLFPRDELNIGMPSYSFSCQTSSLTSMARDGFNFNICIYDGISYLSRAQESAANCRIGSAVTSICPATSTSSTSVADAIFMQRIKSRVLNWRDACKSSTETADGSADALVKSLKKLILGGEIYGSRPCTNIDVCNDNQVQLVVKMLSEVSDDLVPLIISDKTGGPRSVRIVYASSEEDKNLFMNELQNLEEEQSKRVRGFRAVIDLISGSQKPLVAYDCLNDFTFIHSKFLSPLPPTMTEFMNSLRMAFTNVLDINHLLKEIGPLKKANSLPAACSYLKRDFFVPFEMEVAHPESRGNDGMSPGHNVLRITDLFAKLCSILKISHETAVGQPTRSLEEFANVFYPCCSDGVQDLADSSAGWMETVRRVRTDCLVFLWGFRSGIAGGALKSCLGRTHDAFSGDFDLRLVDKSCAVVVLRSPSLVAALLEDFASGTVKMTSEGLKATGYESYVKVCRLGYWEETLADSLDRALSDTSHDQLRANAIYGGSDALIRLDDL